MAAEVSGNGKKAVNPPAGDRAGTARALGLSTGWNVSSYLIAGMVAYGAIGWGIGRAVHAGWLFPVGMLAGLAISVGFVIYRYGRQGSVEQSYGGQRLVERNDR